MSADIDKILRDVEEAKALRHPERAMRVLLECGHLRLMPYIDTAMGVGSFTGCVFCAVNGVWGSRLVVDIAETGVLYFDTYAMKETRD